MLIRFFHVCLWLSGMALTCLFYGFFIEPRRLILTTYDIQPINWTAPDITVALISDIHIGGPNTQPKHIQKLIERVNAQNPDLILMPGDFIDGHVKRKDRSDVANAQIDLGLKGLSELSAPLGVYASLGNHDGDWYQLGYVSSALKRHGINVLDNAAVNVADMCIVGIADAWTGTPSPKPFGDCEQGAPIITLMHSPDAKHVVPLHASLIVAGHTHGGQINLPIIGRARTATKLGRDFAYGLIWEGTRPIIVTSGIGTSILPARFRSPPEIVMITIRGEERASGPQASSP